MRSLRAFLIAAVAALSFVAAPAFAQGMNNVRVQDGIPTGPTISGTTDTAHGLYFGTNRTGVSGHLESGLGSGSLPAVSTCGTGAALATGSTDNAGKITVGTTASNACTLTFGTAYTTAPFCVVQNATTGAGANVYAINTTTIVWSSALADSTVLFYHCIAPSGG